MDHCRPLLSYKLAVIEALAKTKAAHVDKLYWLESELAISVIIVGTYVSTRMLPNKLVAQLSVRRYSGKACGIGRIVFDILNVYIVWSP